MAIITNKFNLPAPIVEAIRRDPYSRGAAHISVTSLIDAPQIHFLKEKHGHEVEIDASEAIWSLLGQAVHTILERAGNRIGADAEDRLFVEVDGVKISGGMDLREVPYNDFTITDYKVSKASAFKIPKKDWERQLNLYAYIWDKNHPMQPVKALSVCLICRDFDRHRVGSEGYPPTPIVRIDIPLWKLHTRERFIRERLALYMAAKQAEFFEDDLPPCSDEDRWMRPDKWAVIKAGGKRATKVFALEIEAMDFVGEGNGVYQIEHRRGGPIRCPEFCEVSEFCKQWQGDRHLYEKEGLTTAIDPQVNSISD